MNSSKQVSCEEQDKPDAELLENKLGIFNKGMILDFVGYFLGDAGLA